MNYRKITAIIRNNVLEKVELKLKALGVSGISVTKVKGYGEYANFFSRDWMVSHTRVEIFIDEKQADVIARAIMETAHLGLEGDGIVAVLPVETVYRIRTLSEATPEELRSL